MKQALVLLAMAIGTLMTPSAVVHAARKDNPLTCGGKTRSTEASASIGIGINVGGIASAEVDVAVAGKVSGSKRDLNISCADGGKELYIQGKPKDPSIKSGYRQVFELKGGPSFAFHLIPNMAGDIFNTTSAFKGARLTLTEIVEINSKNEMVKSLKFANTKNDWTPLNVAETTLDGAVFMTATTALEADVKGKDGAKVGGKVNLAITVQSSADDAAKAATAKLVQDSMKWSLNLTNWAKADGNKLVFKHKLWSSLADFNAKAKVDSSGSVAAEETKFSWDGTAKVQTSGGEKSVPLKLFEYAKDDVTSTADEEKAGKGKQWNEQSAQKIAIVADTTEAFTALFWDPAVGPSSNDAVDSPSTVTEKSGAVKTSQNMLVQLTFVVVALLSTRLFAL